MRRAFLIALMLAVAVAIAGCGSDRNSGYPDNRGVASEPTGATSEPTGATGAPAPPLANRDFFKDSCVALQPKLPGLAEARAKALIKQAGCYARVVRRDDQTFIVTKDLRSNRINLEIDDGRVTEATLG